jgi:hypothetical protein
MYNLRDVGDEGMRNQFSFLETLVNVQIGDSDAVLLSLRS